MSIKAVLFSGLVGVAIISILLSLLWRYGEVTAVSAIRHGAELPKLPKSKSPLLIKMFNYSAMGEYGLDTIVEADSLEVRPRRFMAFNAKSVNEAVLRNARMAFHTYENREPYTDLFEFESAIPFTGNGSNLGRSRVLGRVTRLVADRIFIQFFRDERKIVTLEAKAGLIDKNREEAKFFEAKLQDFQSGRVVSAKKMLWDRARKVFVIPGKYSDTGPSGHVIGKSVEIDMDFKITPYKCLANCAY